MGDRNLRASRSVGKADRGPVRLRGRRSGNNAAHQSARARTEGAGLDGRREPADRFSLYTRRCSYARLCSGSRAALTRRHRRPQQPVCRTAPAGKSWHPDRVRTGFRPGGRRFRRQHGASGGNMTGFTNFEAEIGGKWVELLKEIAPSVARTLFLHHSETAANVAILRAAEGAAAKLEMVVIPAGVNGPAPEIERAITSFAEGGGGGLITAPHVVIAPSLDLIARLAT